MQVREATHDDAPSVRSVARFSMEASYSLSPGTIEGAIKEWYDDERLSEKLDDDDTLVLVAETDEGVVGFSEGQLVGDYGDILWLHVNPLYRGEGVGDELFAATRDALTTEGAETLRGRVLDDNPDGNAFYEEHGLRRVDEETVEIDGTQHVENIYTDEEPDPVETISEGDRELYVDRTDPGRGSKGPLYTVYTDEDRTTKYGFYCGNCDTLVTSMDSMGRIECGECGNIQKPRRWDAAYL